MSNWLDDELAKPKLVIPRALDIEQVKEMLGEYNCDVVYSEEIPLMPEER